MFILNNLKMSKQCDKVVGALLWVNQQNKTWWKLIVFLYGICNPVWIGCSAPCRPKIFEVYKTK